MKQICIAGILLLCMTLNACCCIPSIPLDRLGKNPEGMPPNQVESVSTEVSTEATTEATTAPTEIPTEPTTRPTEPEIELPTEPPLIPVETKPVTSVEYQQVKPYPLPVANPRKEIYDAPGGNYVKSFNTIGYYTIVEQAKDSNGTTWGRLSTGDGWTMVYKQILPDLGMYFASGVGGWGTELSLSGNGTFTGEYSDSDMGDTGYDYPNGTCYVCNFKGRFKVTGIDTYRITLELAALKTMKEMDSQWITGGVRYIASSAYGLDGGEEFILYTPRTPVSILPEDVYYWAGEVPESGTLNCYVLYCPEAGTAFFQG